MGISFNNPKLLRLAEDSKLMERKLGAACAKKFRIRLAALRSVDCVAQLSNMTGNWHELKGDRVGQWGADLDHPLRIIIRANQELARDASGGINWSKVHSVSVVEIADYH